MESYYLYYDRVHIFWKDGSSKIIFFDDNSGKTFFRYKKYSPVNTKHAGIYLGIDANGTGYFLHNHYLLRTVHLVTIAEFTENMALYPYDIECANTPIQVIKIGLGHAIKKQPYHALFYNCQTLTNLACNNTAKSEDVDKWIGRVFIGGAVIIGLNLLFSDKK